MRIIKSDSLLVESVGTNCLVFAHTKAAPSDAAWSSLLDYYDQHRQQLSQYRLFVITDGGGPTAMMRKTFQASFAKDAQGSRTAVISEAAILRFTVSGLALFISNVRSFSSEEAVAAVRYLELANDQVHRVRDCIANLRAEAGPGFATLTAIDPTTIR